MYLPEGEDWYSCFNWMVTFIHGDAEKMVEEDLHRIISKNGYNDFYVRTTSSSVSIIFKYELPTGDREYVKVDTLVNRYIKNRPDLMLSHGIEICRYNREIKVTNVY